MGRVVLVPERRRGKGQPVALDSRIRTEITDNAVVPAARTGVFEGAPQEAVEPMLSKEAVEPDLLRSLRAPTDEGED